jgi:hypothetical protein
MTDLPSRIVLPFVVAPWLTPAQRTKLLEVWANLIVRVVWEAARAARRSQIQAKRPVMWPPPAGKPDFTTPA